jgi:hypothetical protein
MAKVLSGAQASVGAITTVDTVQKNPLGSRAFDEFNNEYIYLAGVASQVAGDWVTYTTAFVAVRLVADAAGPVAIANAAVLAANWGWYQIYGFNTIALSDSVAAAGGLWIDNTTGKVDDSSVAGDFVYGAWSTGASTAGVLPVFVRYPYVGNTAPA